MATWDMVKQFQIDVGEPSKPTGGAQVFVYGRRGYMYGIRGKNFLMEMPNMQPIFRKYKLKSLEGPMTVPVAEAVKKRLEGIAEVTIGPEEEVADNLYLPWVYVKL